MSKTIDERVVEMRFDNRQFEKNVQTSMSSIDKLNQKLDFKGASKGFENINRAAQKVDMSTLNKSVDTVHAKFSALEVMAVTALANITNSAVNAGKRLVKSLSIDQVTAGMSKYEQKTASVQTIMNATGKSIDEVNGYLEKLMWFSDETSYGFTDMTTALGTMTAAGGDIEKLIPLITGVANAVAFAGKGASEFGQVMQFGVNQAYSAGYMGLTDWKTFQGRGVNSKQLQETFIRVAEEMGKIKKGSVTISNFATSLKDKWLDTEVMEKGFSVFGDFTEKVYELKTAIEEGADLSGYSKEVQEWAKTVDKSNVLTADVMEVLGKEYEGVGKKAFQAGQEAKSFTEAIDATKDAVSSGWMETFEIIFGNYEQAKVLWTELCGALWEIFASGGVERNKILKEVLSNNPWDALCEKLKKTTDAIQAPVKKLEEYNDIVNRIIRGDFGNGQTRFDKLAEAGYDWAHAQNLVNEKLGNSFRYATDYTEVQEEQIKQTIELTDAKLTEIGLTEEEIKMYRELEAESKKTGKSIDELIKSMEKADGRTLLIGSFKNVGSALIGIVYSIREAFSDIFPAPTALQIYNFIAGLNKLTQCLRLTDAETGELNETGEKLKRTFKGIFALFDIILTVVGGPIKIVFKALMKVLGAFDLHILDVTASIGDAIVGFRDWIDSTLDFTKVLEYLGTLLKPAAKKVKEWIASFKSLPIVKESLNKIKSVFSSDFGSNILVKSFEVIGNALFAVGRGIKQCYDAFMSLPAVQNVVKKLGNIFTNLFNSISSGLKGVNLDSIVNTITNFFNAVSKWLSGFGDQENNGTNLVDGLGNAISGSVKVVVTAITEICKAIYNTFTDFFDINSPSKVFFTLGKFCIAGLVAGLLFSKEDTASAMSEIGGELLEGVKVAVSNIVDIIKQIDLKTIFAVGGAAVMFKTINNVIGVMDKFAAGVKGFGSMCSAAGTLITNFNNKIFPKETKMEKTSNVVLKMAAAIGILAASIYVLAQLDTGKLWGAVGAIAALALILAGLTLAASKLKVSGGDFGKLSVLLLGISATLLIMATAIKKLEFLNEYNVGPILIGLAGMVAGITLLLLAFAKLTKGTLAKNINKAALLIAQISLTMTMLTLTLKLMSGLDPSQLAKGLSAMALFGAFIAGLIAITNLAGKNIQGLGKTILGISMSMLALIGVIKVISLLKPEELAGGLLCITLFGGIIAGLLAATRLAGGKEVKGIGATIIALSSAMLVLALAVKVLSKMEPGAFTKGVICVAIFGGLITGLIAATRLAGGNNLKGVAGTLLAAVVAMGMMAAIAVILSLISIEGLIKGVTAVSILGAVIALMIHSTKDAKDAKNNIVAMTTAIGIMAASVLVLSLIPINKLAAATIALSSVMGMFALMTKAMGSAVADPKKWGKSVSSILILTTVVAALGGILILMSKWSNPSALIQASAAISILLGTMAGALTILNNTKAMTKAALSKNLTALGVMTAVVAGLALILGALSLVPNPNALLPTAIGLSVLLLTMTGVLAALTLIGKFSKQAYSGIAGLTLMLVPLMGLIAVLAFMPDVSKAMTQMPGIMQVMTALTALLAITAVVGVIYTATGGVAMLGIVGLLAMLVPLMGLVAVLAFMPDVSNGVEKIQGVIQIMSALSDMLVKVSIVGPLAIIGVGALTAITSLMVAVGALATIVGALITAFPQLETFIDTGIPILVKLANGLGQIIGAFVGGLAEGFMNSLPQIGTCLSLFMANAMVFITGTKTVDESVLKGVGILTGAILALTAADLISSVASFFTNGSSFAQLGTELSKFMINALPFITIASTLSDDMMSGVKNLAEAILILTAADMIQGLASWFAGGVSLSDFGAELSGLGAGIVGFANELGTFDESKINTITCGANAIKTLAEAAKAIPNSGGWLGAIMGENDADKFGEQLAGLGASLTSFITNIGTFGSSEFETAKNAASAILEFAKAAAEIPNAGGMFSEFTGDNTLSKFGEEIASFFNNVSSIDSELAKQATETIKEAFKAAGQGTIDSFNEVYTSADNKSKITDAINAFVDNVVDVIDGYKTEDSIVYKKFKDLGAYCVVGFAKGLGEKRWTLSKAATELGDYAYKKAMESIDAHSPSKRFMSVGGYVVSGFAKGITDSLGEVKDSAVALGSTMLKATQSYLGINSPSIVFNKEVGRWVVRGIAEGITADMSAEEAAEQKANNIVEAFKSALSKLDFESYVAKSDYDLWELTDGLNATDDEKHAKKLEYLNGEFKRVNSETSYLYDQYRQMAETLGEENENTRDAFKSYKDSLIETKDLAKQINDETTEFIKNQNESFYNSRDLAYDNRYKEYQLWLNGEGKNATDAVKDAKKLELLNAERTDLLRKEWRQQDEYINILKDVNATQEEIEKEKGEWLDAQLATQNKENEKLDAIKEAQEREIDIAKELNNLASDNADLRYQIWEKTEGRDATDAEKDAAKLSTLNKQLSANMGLYNIALTAYNDAVKEHGKGSIEATNALNNLLNAELQVATLQSDVLDVQEAIADREERFKERQKNSKAEYADYIEKYKDFYLKNGMSLEELEKDAKLVSGFDPNAKSPVSTMISKTNKDLAKLDTNPEYQNALSGITNIGVSCVDALSAGITDSIPTVTETATNIVTECAKAMTTVGKLLEWTHAGVSLVNGFISGVRTQTKYAAEAAAKMASEALAAAKETFDINSPSRAFAEIGKYAVLGLAQGLNDSTKLASDAAANVGDRTIDNLQNIIARVVDVINSDIDSEPTIRPVLDLSNVESGTSRLNAMFSRSRAISISNGMNRRNGEGIQNGSGSSSGGDTYQFTQNNYSPKALSSAEIYRQTHNQFSALKNRKMVKA